jgi:hypothetical protein
MKLVELKKTIRTVDIEELIQKLLEYWSKHGGLYAYITIKKLIPKYESGIFA